LRRLKRLRLTAVLGHLLFSAQTESRLHLANTVHP